jgi:hypothetical protein
MEKIVFEDAGGLLKPLLPFDVDGNALVPDGVRLLTLAQAAARVGKGEAELRTFYVEVLGEPFSDDEAPLFVAADGADVAPGRPVAPAVLERKRELLYKHRYEDRGFTREQFDWFMATAEERKLSPYAGQIYAELQERWVKVRGKDEVKTEVVPIVSIVGLRAIAHRTREFKAFRKEAFEYLEEGDLRPKAASCVVVRMTDGIECEFEGRALYRNYYTPGPVWDRMPEVCLSKCAEAAALRVGELVALPAAPATLSITQPRHRLLGGVEVFLLGAAETLHLVEKGADGGHRLLRVGRAQEVIRIPDLVQAGHPRRWSPARPGICGRAWRTIRANAPWRSCSESRCPRGVFHDRHGPSA